MKDLIELGPEEWVCKTVMQNGGSSRLDVGYLVKHHGHFLLIDFQHVKFRLGLNVPKGLVPHRVEVNGKFRDVVVLVHQGSQNLVGGIILNAIVFQIQMSQFALAIKKSDDMLAAIARDTALCKLQINKLAVRIDQRITELS